MGNQYYAGDEKDNAIGRLLLLQHNKRSGRFTSEPRKSFIMTLIRTRAAALLSNFRIVC